MRLRLQRRAEGGHHVIGIEPADFLHRAVAQRDQAGRVGSAQRLATELRLHVVPPDAVLGLACPCGENERRLIGQDVAARRFPCSLQRQPSVAGIRRVGLVVGKPDQVARQVVGRAGRSRMLGDLGDRKAKRMPPFQRAQVLASHAPEC